MNNPVNLGDPSGEFVAAAALATPPGLIAACAVGIAYVAIPGFRDIVNQGASTLLNSTKAVSDDIIDAGIKVLNDPNTAPGNDWKWKGPEDKGGYSRGSSEQGTKESLRSDPNNPAHPPHTDYTNPKGQGYRIFEDGTFEAK